MRSVNCVVFVGPSLPSAEVAELRGFRIKEPIRRGDLATCKDCDIIVIVDGEFAQSLSVSPKEILALLDSGKVVIGASSMGALRAAELQSFGMIGIGWVFRKFARAKVRMEDDVALTYSPLDFMPLTIPMVDLDFRLDALVRESVITDKQRRTVLLRARKIFYADRSGARLAKVIEAILGPALTEQIGIVNGRCHPSVKSVDAREAIAYAGSLQR